MDHSVSCHPEDPDPVRRRCVRGTLPGMAETQQNPTGQQPQQPASSSARRSGTPAVFADGSTKEQQERLVREAKEANQSTKEYADAEREARSQ